MTAPRIVLASASPRRQALLGALVSRFEILPAGVDERLPDGLGDEAVVLLAERKARVVRRLRQNAMVVAADTLVWCDNQLLGKPSGPDEALAFLRLLRGRTHRVVTGVCVHCADTCATAVISTDVLMRSYGDQEIQCWVASGAAYDKAGAYAIQDAVFHPVTNWDGCYCNVMGLPLWDLRDLLLRTSHRLRLRRPDRTIPVCTTCPRRQRDPSS